MTYKTHGRGNVRNRKAYECALDMIKFDMINVQNPRVSPTDLDSFMERKGHICMGEVKLVGTSPNKGQEILRQNMRKYHGAWYFFTHATVEGLETLELDSDFINAFFSVADGWYNYELYIVLSCYHQLMYLFANTYNYGSHPRLLNDKDLMARSTSYFVEYCKFVCEEFAEGRSIVMPSNTSDLYKNADYAGLRGFFAVVNGV